jgi:PAS domain S-box-containing protein
MVVDVNLTAAKLLGIERKQLINRRFERFVEDGFKDQWYRHFLHAKQNPGTSGCELPLRHENGIIKYVHIDCLNVHSNGAAPQLRVTLTDVTERKRSETELRIAAVAFETEEGIIVGNADRTIIRVNKAFTRITGYSSEDVIGQQMVIFRPGRHDEEHFKVRWACVETDGYWQGEVLEKRKNGEPFPMWLTMTAVYDADKLQRQGGLPQQQIYLDSPMAISASKIYAEHSHLFNGDDPEFIKAAPKGWQQWLQGLVYSETAEQSMAINRIAGGAIIIAGSGMCNGGRIRHHLKYNLWRRNAHVIIAGYQAEGTLGRILVDGKKKFLKILGSEVNVEAKIHTLGALSAHADQSQLLSWASHFDAPKPRLFLVHGEKAAALSLQTCFKRRGWQAEIPKIGERINF